MRANTSKPISMILKTRRAGGGGRAMPHYLALETLRHRRMLGACSATAKRQAPGDGSSLAHPHQPSLRTGVAEKA